MKTGAPPGEGMMKFRKEADIEIDDQDLVNLLHNYACEVLQISPIGRNGRRVLLDVSFSDIIFVDGNYYKGEKEASKNPDVAAIIRAIEVINKYKI